MESFLKQYFDYKPSEYSWLFPPGYDMAKVDEYAANGLFPIIPDLFSALLYAIVLGFCRSFLNYFFMEPFAVYAMKLKITPFAKVSVIDSSVIVRKSKSKKLSQAELEKVSKETALSIDVVTDYLLRKKKHTLQKKKIVKFVEALWRFILYSCLLFVGYQTLFVPGTVSWVQDTKNLWTDWPFLPVHEPTILYYLSELAVYFHFLHWTDVQRSDSLEMLVHHFATIGLIVFSYISNFTRVGTVILLLHDTSDVFLESAKCFNYVSKAPGRKWASVFCDTLFAMFAVSFFVTRLVLFPRNVLYSVLVEGPNALGSDFPGFLVFVGLLLVLQLLHVFWFYLIARMVVKLFTGGIEKDIRSDDDEEGAATDKPSE